MKKKTTLLSAFLGITVTALVTELTGYASTGMFNSESVYRRTLTFALIALISFIVDKWASKRGEK